LKYKNFLFNFAVSHSGGGYKRLYAYANWFNLQGGAYFIVHPSCAFLVNEFPNNNFFIINQKKIQRLINDCSYLKEIMQAIDLPQLYYSYGIPIYHKVGKINWFHLSNVLPLNLKGIPLSLFDKVKLGYLGRKIRTNFINTEIVSAESHYSLNLINSSHAIKCISVNGSDDEIQFFNSEPINKKDIAVILGTYSYKALQDSYLIFQKLNLENSKLKLFIIGDERRVPRNFKSYDNVILTGILKRNEVMEYLRKAKYYISTTYIENSYNAASEGIYFADESYISDIGPHRELLAGMSFKNVEFPSMNRSVLHLKREEINTSNLQIWDNIITEMISEVSKCNA
jgi:hypothetical protein